MQNIIGIDLGGTSIKAGLVSTKGRILKKYEIPTEANKGAKSIINKIISSINKLKNGRIIGIGIGSPGPMDYKKGIIANPVNLPFDNTPLRKIIQNKYKVKTCLDNDANCFALAEAIFGQGKKYENVLGITLGTGLGGGFVIGKRIFHGRGNATEFGHMTIKFDGTKAKSGNDGDIEEYAAARGIRRLYDGKNEPYSIYKFAMGGDKKAKKAFEYMGYYLGIELTNLLYAFDPDIIVIGGKISNAWKFFSKKMNETIKKRYFAKPCPVVKSNLKDAGILGAAALVFEKN